MVTDPLPTCGVRGRKNKIGGSFQNERGFSFQNEQSEKVRVSVTLSPRPNATPQRNWIPARLGVSFRSSLVGFQRPSFVVRPQD